MNRWVNLVQNCSVFENFEKQLGRPQSVVVDEFEGGYENGLLYASTAMVFLICLFVTYAFIRSAMFRHTVKQILMDQSKRDMEENKMHQQAQALKRLCRGTETIVPCKVSFAFLSYSIAPHHLLHQVTGYFAASKVTAIMGPSGSGKTTLLNLMSGRMRKGTFSGHRMLNDRRYSKENYDAFMASQGYVEQTDTFIETMTVRESLLFAGYLRLDDNMPLAQKIERVNSVLKVVGLDKVADIVIGGMISGISGISGGQKRRLSIATELLRLPSILLLDEPTSGLDATTSLFLIKLLHRLATEQNITIVTTIHQPRAEIYDLFHNLLLLDTGGFVSYCGDAGNVIDYLGNNPAITIDRKAYENPADFVIDALGLDPERQRLRAAEDDKVESGNNVHVRVGTMPPLAVSWEQSEASKQILRQVAANDLYETEEQVPRPKLSWLHVQTWTYFERRASRLHQNIWQALVGVAQTILIALVIISAFSYEPLGGLVHSTEITSDEKQVFQMYGRMYQNVMLLFTIASYAMVIQYLEIVPEYFVERPLLQQERKSNVISYHSYIYSCFMMEIPKAVTTSIVLMGLTTLVHDWSDLTSRALLTLHIILILGICAWQSIICCVCCLSDQPAPVYSILFLFLGSGLLFSGICVAYGDMWPIWYWCYYASAPALTARSLILATVSTTVQDYLMDDMELKLMSPEAMIVVLIMTCIIGRLVAIGILYYRDSHAKKLVYVDHEWITTRLAGIQG